MPLRFRRRIALLPGLRINVGLHGASVSVGTRGAWYTVGPKGRRATVGWPGTGISYTEHYPPAPAPHSGHRLAFALVVAIVFAAVWWAALARL